MTRAHRPGVPLHLANRSASVRRSPLYRDIVAVYNNGSVDGRTHQLYAPLPARYNARIIVDTDTPRCTKFSLAY